MTATGMRHESKTRFLDAALHVIRAKGYSATRIEDICEAAGLTKGSFFHHFDSKEALALDVADYWIKSTGIVFDSASYRAHTDPLERLQSYVDYRNALLMGELPDVTCLAGTMVQEVYDTHPALREACKRAIDSAGISPRRVNRFSERRVPSCLPARPGQLRDQNVEQEAEPNRAAC